MPIFRNEHFWLQAFVNWDPVDKTVLANEQVDEKGCSWRSGAPVEKRLLKQWFIKTSHYAKALREGLKSVPANWFDVVDLQQNWIGELNGHRIKLEVVDDKTNQKLCDCDAFLKDISELQNAQCLLVPTGHELCTKFPADNNGKLNVSIKHPKHSDKFLPVFQIEFKPEVYFEQPNASFGLIPDSTPTQTDSKTKTEVWSEEEKQQVIEKLSSEGVLSGPISAKFRDWLISRQRYWGTPIPVVHCDQCGAVPVPYEDLPVKLPLLKETSVRGGSILAGQEDWINTKCPK